MASSHSLSLTTPAPPTPPKQSKDSDDLQAVIDFLDVSYDWDSIDAIPSTAQLATPPTSSPSRLQEPAASTTSSLGKRARFTDEWTEHDCNDDSQSIRPLPPSKMMRLSGKSILKPSPLRFSFEVSDEKKSIYQRRSSLLRTSIQQLLEGDAASRPAAYKASSRGLLKAGHGRAVLVHIPSLQDLIRQDIIPCGQPPEIEQINTRLQALSFTATLLSSVPAAAFSVSFLTFLLDVVTKTVMLCDTSKQIYAAHLQLMLSGKWYLDVITPTHVKTLLRALSDAHLRMNGKRFIVGRFDIYRRLLQSHPTFILDELEQILQLVFEAILDQDSSSRASALRLAEALSAKLGHLPDTAEAVNHFFGKAHPYESSCWAWLTSRLSIMAEDDDGCLAVPQIWTVVFLLLRKDAWRFLQTQASECQWLRIFSTCFRHENPKVQLNAWKAWPRIIYAASFTPGHVMWDGLLLPIIAALFVQYQEDRIIKRALSAYCVLLHFAFPASSSDPSRSGAPDAARNVRWFMLIDRMLTSSLHFTAAARSELARIMASILWEGRSNIWNASLGLEQLGPSRLFSWRDLAVLDPMWVRANFEVTHGTVTEFLEVQYYSGQMDEKTEDMWRGFLFSIRAAGSREVLVSSELRDAVFLLTESTRASELSWDQRFVQLTAGPYDGFESLTMFRIGSALGILGPTAFLKTYFSQDVSGQLDPRKGLQGARSGFLCILCFLARNSETSATAPSFIEDVRYLFSECVSDMSTMRSKFLFLQECSDVLLEHKGLDSKRPTALCIWEAIMDLISGYVLQLQQKGPNELGEDLTQAALAILIPGLTGGERAASTSLNLLDEMLEFATVNRLSDKMVFLMLQPVYDYLCVDKTIASLDCAAMAICHLRPLAGPASATTSLKTCGVLSSSNAQTNLHGRSIIFNLYNEICERIPTAMKESNPLCSRHVSNFFETVATFLMKCALALNTPSGLAYDFVEHLQLSVTTALELHQFTRMVRMRDNPGSRTRLLKMWTVALELSFAWATKDHVFAPSPLCERMLFDGFQDPNQALVDATVKSWNASLRNVTELIFSDNFIRDLTPIRERVHLRHFSKIKHTTATSAHIEDSPDVACTPNKHANLEDLDPSPRLTKVSSGESPAKARQDESRVLREIVNKNNESVASQAQFDYSEDMDPPSTPPHRASDSLTENTDPLPLRRHDSQIEFVNVNSSPLQFQEQLRLSEREQERQEMQKANRVLFKNVSSSTMPDPFTSQETRGHKQPQTPQSKIVPNFQMSSSFTEQQAHELGTRQAGRSESPTPQKHQSSADNLQFESGAGADLHSALNPMPIPADLEVSQDMDVPGEAVLGTHVTNSLTCFNDFLTSESDQTDTSKIAHEQSLDHSFGFEELAHTKLLEATAPGSPPSIESPPSTRGSAESCEITPPQPCLSMEQEDSASFGCVLIQSSDLSTPQSSSRKVQAKSTDAETIPLPATRNLRSAKKRPLQTAESSTQYKRARRELSTTEDQINAPTRKRKQPNAISDDKGTKLDSGAIFANLHQDDKPCTRSRRRASSAFSPSSSLDNTGDRTTRQPSSAKLDGVSNQSFVTQTASPVLATEVNSIKIPTQLTRRVTRSSAFAQLSSSQSETEIQEVAAAKDTTEEADGAEDNIEMREDEPPPEVEEHNNMSDIVMGEAEDQEQGSREGAEQQPAPAPGVMGYFFNALHNLGNLAKSLTFSSEATAEREHEGIHQEMDDVQGKVVRVWKDGEDMSEH